ncbi:beta-lactamase class A/beta-lactamase class A CARB-1 [Roseibium hamelinense]|uniref:Beta-lactamase n=1 Tax=Roseibium hamelinense TaxID=150831 RepID=A0A562TAZ0_9HYPH|nr:class A beta-lactamase [Roseibium hamelinense]TWI90438.1 beta-lactamase class A/beta-lactamase class A CARB-1 [Roseibium hamelinense]
MNFALKVQKLRSVVFQAAAAAVIAFPIAPAAYALDEAALENKLNELEQREDARIGLALIDTQTGTEFSFRGTERFALNSTFKAFACGALLSQAEAGGPNLSESRSIREDDLVSWSPVTKNRVGTDTITLRESCEATMVYSDNTAANIVLQALGGPAAFTAFMRDIGDRSTRLDRMEPDLNVVPAGTDQDTTTPEAAANSLKELITGELLAAPSKAQLIAWLSANTTAKHMLRPHLPEGWTIGDRSGASRDRKRSVIAVIYPPDQAPVFVAVYLHLEKPAGIAERDAIIAELGKSIFDSL